MSQNDPADDPGRPSDLGAPAASGPPSGVRPTGARRIALDLSLLPEGLDPALLIQEFVSGSLDHLESAETALLALESDPGNAEHLHTAFRAFHSLKGSSGYLGMPSFTELAHRAEDLLARVRDGRSPCDAACIDLGLRALDILRALVDQLSRLSADWTLDIPLAHERLIEELRDPVGLVSPATAADPASPHVPAVGAAAAAPAAATPAAAPSPGAPVS
jgi:two-component system chemotaxis sensor kinase CheA